MMACATGTLTADMVKWKTPRQLVSFLLLKGTWNILHKGDVIHGDIKQHVIQPSYSTLAQNLLGKNMLQMAAACLALWALVKTLEQRSIELMDV